MGWTIFYLLLLVAYLLSWGYSIYHPSTAPGIITRLSGLAALLTGLVAALQKSSLKVYFLLQKLAIRFFADTTGRWWFAARFDGHFDQQVLRRLCEHFSSKDFRLNCRVENETALTAEIEIDQTLYLKMQFDPGHLSAVDLDHVTVLSRVMEVSYGHAKRKLEQQIVPILQALTEQLQPSNSSFELDVKFLKRNPFFAIYIAHLRPSQVQDFRVVLHVDGSHPTGRAEKVEITKENVHVTAKTALGFQNIAEQFVLLSPDLKILKAGR